MTGLSAGQLACSHVKLTWHARRDSGPDSKQNCQDGTRLLQGSAKTWAPEQPLSNQEYCMFSCLVRDTASPATEHPQPVQGGELRLWQLLLSQPGCHGINTASNANCKCSSSGSTSHCMTHHHPQQALAHLPGWPSSSRFAVVAAALSSLTCRPMVLASSAEPGLTPLRVAVGAHSRARSSAASAAT